MQLFPLIGGYCLITCCTLTCGYYAIQNSHVLYAHCLISHVRSGSVDHVAGVAIATLINIPLHGATMIYALTTPSGRVFEFYIKSCADLYCGMYGGTITVLPGDNMHETCDTLRDCDQLELI
jgi:hypothetical protein